MSSLALDSTSVTRLVHEFYDRVRADTELQPVFDNVIQDNWDTHLARMVDFWSTVMLGSRQFQGNVYGKHIALSGIEPEHFRRWLQLFQETVNDLFSGAVAEDFIAVAKRIAASLQLGFFGEVLVGHP